MKKKYTITVQNLQRDFVRFANGSNWPDGPVDILFDFPKDGYQGRQVPVCAIMQCYKKYLPLFGQRSIEEDHFRKSNSYIK